jgi:hypothetical protein
MSAVPEYEPNIVVHDVEQGTEEWHALRRGMVTASAMGKLIEVASPDPTAIDCTVCGAKAGTPCLSMAASKTPTPIKTIHPARTAQASSLPPVYRVADNETSRNLALTLAAERLAGFTEDLPMSSDMWRGRDAEPYARDLYSGHYHHAEECGFIVRDDFGVEIGYSPDGLVGLDGCIEIKAPRAKNHVATILADQVPAQYMAQCQTALLVSGRDWCDFVSYVGGMPLWVKRVKPDPVWFDVIVAAAKQAESDIAEIVDDYRAKTTNLPATERIEILEII